MRCLSCNGLLPLKYSKKSNGEYEDLCPGCLEYSKALLLELGDDEDLFKLPNDTFDEDY